MPRTFLVVVIMLFATSSCVPLVPPSSPLSTPLSPTLSILSPIQTPESTTIVQRAVKDLADRLAIEPDAIQVVSVSNDDFPVDDLLGCGNSQSDIVRPGFVTGQSIRLQANNIIYEYRAHGGQLVFCEINP